MGLLDDINPLEVLNVRRVHFPPDHFAYIDILASYNIENYVVEWISVNLKNRFYVGDNVRLNDKTNKVVNTLAIGFEDHKELSYFAIACPVLKYT